MAVTVTTFALVLAAALPLSPKAEARLLDEDLRPPDVRTYALLTTQQQPGQERELLPPGQRFAPGQLLLRLPENPVELLHIHVESMAFSCAARQRVPENPARDLL